MLPRPRCVRRGHGAVAGTGRPVAVTECGVRTSKGHAMNFSEGQVVVHPHHGPATVTAITTRVIRGEQRQYVKLEVFQSNLVVGVPLAAAAELGVRPLLGSSGISDLFAVLSGPTGPVQSGWSRRIKEDVERLRTGNVATIAALVRDLTRRQHDKGLSLGEKNLLRDARGPLLAEVAIVLAVDEEEAAGLVDAAVLDAVSPRLPELATAS